MDDESVVTIKADTGCPTALLLFSSRSVTVTLSHTRVAPALLSSKPALIAHSALDTPMSNMDDGQRKHGRDARPVPSRPVAHPSCRAVPCPCSQIQAAYSLTGIPMTDLASRLCSRFLRSLLGSVRRCGRHIGVERARRVCSIHARKGEGEHTTPAHNACTARAVERRASVVCMRWLLLLRAALDPSARLPP